MAISSKCGGGGGCDIQHKRLFFIVVNRRQGGEPYFVKLWDSPHYPPDLGKKKLNISGVWGGNA